MHAIRRAEREAPTRHLKVAPAAKPAPVLAARNRPSIDPASGHYACCTQPRGHHQYFARDVIAFILARRRSHRATRPRVSTIFDIQVESSRVPGLSRKIPMRRFAIPIDLRARFLLSAQSSIRYSVRVPANWTYRSLQLCRAASTRSRGTKNEAARFLSAPRLTEKGGRINRGMSQSGGQIRQQDQNSLASHSTERESE
jgi:hypothetical protein